MRGNLKNAVTRGVDNGFSGAHVFYAQLFDDICARSRPVRQHARYSRLADKFFDHLLWKAVWIGWERVRQMHAHQLPVPADRIFPGRNGPHLAKRALSRVNRLHAGHWRNVPKADAFQVGHIETADGLCGVTERVAACVPILRGIWRFTSAYTVQNDNYHAFDRFHCLFASPEWIYF